MFEARCGMRCSGCAYRERTGCAGCAAICDPFWGHCPVKGCCEGREHDHCGQCEDFVCKLLHSFAYDPEHGDNGLRLRNCRSWKEEK